jgi:hypothetical protein
VASLDGQALDSRPAIATGEPFADANSEASTQHVVIDRSSSLETGCHGVTRWVFEQALKQNLIWCNPLHAIDAG